MEYIAIPAIALGAMWTMAQQEKDKNHISKESFKNNNATLPNTHTPVENYPVINPEEIEKNPNYYPLSNSTVDKYFGADPKKLKIIDPPKNKLYTSLTGQKISKKGFKHNNMQPFFGSSVKQRIGDYKGNESILDNMQGAGSQKIRKESLAPLFKPQENMSWVHGMPVHTDFVQSRMNPSQKMANVKPWEEEHVGPGLNQGYTSLPSGGFNSGMEAREKWIPKTVDQLRIKTNPKMTYSGVQLGGSVGPGRYARGIQGKIEKNRPDTFYINGPDRYFTTTGVEKAQTARSKQPLLPTNRLKSKEVVGPGFSDAATYVAGKYNQPRRPQLQPDTKYPGIPAAQGRSNDDFGKNGYRILPNCRTCTTNDSHIFGAASSVAKALIAPILDLARPSRKENTVGTIRPTGNAHSTIPQLPVYNPSDTLPVTHRETTEANPFGGNINRLQYGDGYLSNPQQKVFQQRNTTNCSGFTIPGNTPATSNAPTYNAAYNAHLNADKEQLSKSRTNMGNMDVFTGYQNIAIHKQDNDRNNRREGIIDNGTNMSIPSLSTYGELTPTQSLPQGIDCTRNQPDILNAFRCNPYTQPLNSVA